MDRQTLIQRIAVIERDLNIANANVAVVQRDRRLQLDTMRDRERAYQANADALTGALNALRMLVEEMDEVENAKAEEAAKAILAAALPQTESPANPPAKSPEGSPTVLDASWYARPDAAPVVPDAPLTAN